MATREQDHFQPAAQTNRALASSLCLCNEQLDLLPSPEKISRCFPDCVVRPRGASLLSYWQLGKTLVFNPERKTARQSSEYLRVISLLSTVSTRIARVETATNTLFLNDYCYRICDITTSISMTFPQSHARRCWARRRTDGYSAAVRGCRSSSDKCLTSRFVNLCCSSNGSRCNSSCHSCGATNQASHLRPRSQTCHKFGHQFGRT